MPYEEDEQESGNQKDKPRSQPFVLKSTNVAEQADSSPPWIQWKIFRTWTIPWLCRKGSGNEVRKREDDMTNGHEGQGDRPVQLVEQLQVRPAIENKTLVTRLDFIRPRYYLGSDLWVQMSIIDSLHVLSTLLYLTLADEYTKLTQTEFEYCGNTSGQICN